MLYIDEWMQACIKGNWEHIENWGTRWIMGFEGKGTGMYHTNLFCTETLKRLLERNNFKVQHCLITETRTKNKNHFEYRKDGDIECVAIK